MLHQKTLDRQISRLHPDTGAHSYQLAPRHYRLASPARHRHAAPGTLLPGDLTFGHTALAATPTHQGPCPSPKQARSISHALSPGRPPQQIKHPSQVMGHSVGTMNSGLWLPVLWHSLMRDHGLHRHCQPAPIPRSSRENNWGFPLLPLLSDRFQTNSFSKSFCRICFNGDFYATIFGLVTAGTNNLSQVDRKTEAVAAGGSPLMPHRSHPFSASRQPRLTTPQFHVSRACQDGEAPRHPATPPRSTPAATPLVSVPCTPAPSL